jgi:hypothetical protein
MTLQRLWPSFSQPSRIDPPELAKLRSPIGRRFPGKMRIATIVEFLRVYHTELGLEPIVCDPISGSGTTAIATHLLGGSFFGCEGDPGWYDCLEDVVQTNRIRGQVIFGDSRFHGPIQAVWKFLFLSPPFPTVHSQGHGEFQDALRESKQTDAGNEYGFADVWGCGSKPKKEKWIGTLHWIVSRWATKLSTGGIVAVHIKDFTVAGELIDGGEWVAEAFAACGLKTIGYHPIILAYRSGFKEWQSLPLRTIVEAPMRRRVKLDCTHWKTYTKEPLADRTVGKKARCVECGSKEPKTLSEEKLVVAMRP